MKIQVEITKNNRHYVATVRTLGFWAAELEQLIRMGEPVVETGGPFSGSFTRPNEAPVAIEFDLPPLPRKLKSGFPVEHVFDLNDSVNADGQAKIWTDTLVSRLTSAKNTLMTETSPFEAETIVTV